MNVYVPRSWCFAVASEIARAIQRSKTDKKSTWHDLLEAAKYRKVIRRESGEEERP